jgi:methionyl-tRNA formyltransferase
LFPPEGSAPTAGVRTVFLGSSQFAVTVLEALAQSSHRPSLVVTPPDRPKGRGLKLAPPPAAEASRKLGIELVQSGNVNDASTLAAIESVEPGALAVCEFGQLIARPLLERWPMLNVHPSLLPRWRGAAPIERALLAGDERTGVTIFKVVEALDAGPIALQRPEPIEPDDDYATLAQRLAELGAKLLVEALDLLESDRLELTPQPEAGATYADKIDPAERRLDPAEGALQLERRVRALAPHVGTYLQLGGGERLGLRRATPSQSRLAAGKLAVDDGRLLLGCGDGTLELLEVIPPGKRQMSAADYLRGRRQPPSLA